MNRTFVIGVGMTKFDKPGTKEGDYPDWARQAGEKALADARIEYREIAQAYAGYCYGDSTYGQRCLYELGLTGIQRQVDGAKVALQHNIGLGGAAVVTVYRKAA
jgi:acetyl-CoA acetyltransferase